MLIKYLYNLITTPYCHAASSISSQFSVSEWETQDDLYNTLNNVQDIMLGVAGGLAVLAIIYAAFQYATSGGDETKIATAKKTITFTIIGVVMIAVFYLILSFIIKRGTGIGT